MGSAQLYACHKQEVGWEVFKSKAFGKPHCKGMAEKVHDAIVEEREHLRCLHPKPT